MKRTLKLAASCAMLALTVPANAMNWCSLPQITPETERDFDRIAGSVTGLTGCVSTPSESAHHLEWQCSDDPQTDPYEGVQISLVREPGKSVHLIVLGVGLTDLSMLRGCGIGDLHDEGRFVPGNVAIRDRIRFGRFGPRLTLASVIDTDAAAVISDTATSGEHAGVQHLLEVFFGFRTELYPSTEVKLAGMNPISTDVRSIVTAFQERGSAVLSTNLDTDFPEWKLSSPIGLAGVEGITITGFINHLIRAKYDLATTQDYERYIELLDNEYGQSERTLLSGCSRRRWNSGRMTIRGEHCPGVSNSLWFLNGVAVDQVDLAVAKLEGREKADKVKPPIDRDMF